MSTGWIRWRSRWPGTFPEKILWACSAPPTSLLAPAPGRGSRDSMVGVRTTWRRFRCRHRPGPAPAKTASSRRTRDATCSASARRAFSDRIRSRSTSPVWAVDREPRRQPVLPRRHRKGRRDPGGARGADRARRSAGPPDRARLHHRRVRRTAERHRPHAVLPDRPRARERRGRRAPERERREGPRSPSSRATSRRSARSRRCSSTTSRRSSFPTARSSPGTDPETGERIDLVTAFQVAGDPDPARAHAHGAPRLPWPGQLRRHVHLQHHAVVHRRARHGAAAHGGAARPTIRAGSASSPSSSSTAS